MYALAAHCSLLTAHRTRRRPHMQQNGQVPQYAELKLIDIPNADGYGPIPSNVREAPPVSADNYDAIPLNVMTANAMERTVAPPPRKLSQPIGVTPYVDMSAISGYAASSSSSSSSTSTAAAAAATPPSPSPRTSPLPYSALPSQPNNKSNNININNNNNSNNNTRNSNNAFFNNNNNNNNNKTLCEVCKRNPSSAKVIIFFGKKNCLCLYVCVCFLHQSTH